MPAAAEALLEYYAGVWHIERCRASTQSLGIPLNALRTVSLPARHRRALRRGLQRARTGAR